jgi:hypothetical protein
MVLVISLPAALVDVSLHLTSRRDAWGRACDDASAGVNNGNSIASALSHGLVKLHLVLLEGVVVVRGSSRGKKERSGLSLVLQRRGIRRTRGQR